MKLLNSKEGQSLVEILIAVSIGSLIIGAATYTISFILSSGTANQQRQIATAFADDSMNRARAVADANWLDIYNLSTKSATSTYFTYASGTKLYVIEGKEGVLSDDITSGLVGHWKFDEATGTTAYDHSGKSYQGTLTNSPSRATSTCKVSYCLSFDGTNDHVLSSTTTIPGSGTGISIAGWVYPIARQSVGDRDMIFRQNGYLTITPTGQLSSYFYGLASEGYHNGSTVIPLNTWTHLAVTYNSTNGVINMYVNNTLDFSTLTSGSISNNQTSFVIGGEPCCNRYFNGRIDDVRVYNRALSADEIERIYNSVIFTRYFSVENVNRDASDNIVTSGGNNDPSTQKITANVEWATKALTPTFQIIDYITRWKNKVFDQSDWSGGSGQTGPLTEPNDKFSTSDQIDNTTVRGAIKLILP